MFDALMNKLNGHGADVPSLEETLAQVGRDRETVTMEIAGLHEQRRQLLLADASDSDLDKLERRIDRAGAKLEKLKLAEPLLRERITALKREARARRWQSHLETYRAEAQGFIAAARSCAQTHDALLSIVRQAQAEGFEGDVARAMPATPNINNSAICAYDLLDLFERSVFPAPIVAALKSTASTPPVSLRARARLPHERQSHGDVHNLAPAFDQAPPRPAPAPTLDDADQLGPDEVRAIVLRSGFPGPAGHCRAGQKIRLQRGAAQIAALAGSIEIIEAHVGLPDSYSNDRTFKKVST